jgi:hypothetical protein
MSEDNDLEHQTCGAILLQFREPKFYDLTIPDAYNIYSLVVIAGKIMCGEKVNLENVNCITTCHDLDIAPLREEYLFTLSPRVSKGLFNILKESRTEHSPLTLYMNEMNDSIAHEWHFGHGDWYRFREGKREKIEKEILSYFNNLELVDFNHIGEIIQPYIGLTNSPAKCK